jgi:hypothetical protein
VLYFLAMKLNKKRKLNPKVPEKKLDSTPEDSLVANGDDGAAASGAEEKSDETVETTEAKLAQPAAA